MLRHYALTDSRGSDLLSITAVGADGPAVRQGAGSWALHSQIRPQSPGGHSPGPGRYAAACCRDNAARERGNSRSSQIRPQSPGGHSPGPGRYAAACCRDNAARERGNSRREKCGRCQYLSSSEDLALRSFQAFQPRPDEPAGLFCVSLGFGGGLWVALADSALKRGKRSADEESLDGEGAGGADADADAADESSGTKRAAQSPRADGTPAPAGPQAPSPPQGSPQDQHHFLRSRVRPQSKRPRKEPPCAVGSGAGGSGPRGKGADGGGSSSGNVPGVGPTAAAGGSRASSRSLGSSGGEKEEGKKARRQWESWSTEDKNTFFEGLYEHGKDFEAIQNNIALKYKKKGKPASMVKNKEQVRHFYYRTWHKLTKYIDFDHVFSRGLKKSSQELYGLICYGVAKKPLQTNMRKKIGGCMDDKNAAKLNELIQVGATTVRHRGRNLRVKAPMCRALRKLCDPDGLSDEEDQKPVRLPLRVPVELQPRNNHAWARVQSLAQNPRLRMIVELHRKVSSLIEFLKQKWALHEVRIAPEANAVSTASMRPTQEEQATSSPGKVVTVSSRSPRCPRNQSALRSGKTFTPSCAPCSSGLRNPPGPLLVASPPSAGSSDTDGGLFAVPTTLPPNSRHGKLFSPSKEAELAFRQHLTSISMQSDFFLPKPRKLRNRHLRKPLVVQRTLLPRPSESQLHSVCPFSVLSNSAITGRGSLRPIQSSLTKAALSRPIVPKVLPAQAPSHLASAIDLAAKSAGIIPGSPLPALDPEGLPGNSPLPSDEVAAASGQDSTETHMEGDPVPAVGGASEPFASLSVGPAREPVPDNLQNGTPAPPTPPEGSRPRLSPPNVSALLDLSLPGPPEDVLSQGEPATQISDSIIELAISSGHYGEGVPLSPAKLNGSDSSKSLPSPSDSPQPHWIASPTHDPQWYPSDSTDSSLSSLFASFISPEKSRKTLPTPAGAPSGTSLLGPSLLDGNSRDSFVSRSLADVAETGTACVHGAATPGPHIRGRTTIAGPESGLPCNEIPGDMLRVQRAHPSVVVDSQLVCMMNESSIDYISRFNDLAQELALAEPGRREVLFDGGGGGPSVGDLSQ
ncbi:Protein cramped-like protein [Tupaia chinensis]|uniref:Protein cramped-like n=1 Tax=Tupaia chinensis TaxID=246437 RepID=L9KXW8_TUPCH|nr:Protein cramped-like protein [Tupaia chinensis]